MNWKASIFLCFVLISTLLSCYDNHITLNNDAFDRLQKYRFLKDGVGITIKQFGDSASGTSDTKYLAPVKRFNRGGKRGNTILITGDLPCFGQMRTYPENSVGPDLIKLGDGRLRIQYNSNTFWLDSIKDIITCFQPGITTYRVRIPKIKDVLFDLTVFHAGTWGIVAKLEISNIGNKTEIIGVDFVYGGIRRCESSSNAGYFIDNNKAEKDNTLEIAGGNAIIGDKSIIDLVGVTTIPEVKPLISDDKALFIRKFVLNKSEIQSFYLITSYNKNRLNLLSQLKNINPEKLLSENQKYYSDILSKALISTPDTLIDGGFRIALINLDNVFTDTAWIEGIQWWNAYWTNLFQISAAVSLDQKLRAKSALAFFNTSEYGPAPIIKSDKSALKGSEDEGLDYYIYALTQYINSTCDTAFLKGIWPNVMASLKRIMEQKDPDGDKLLYWHLGCNGFLYQADLLGMPGKSASPSIMTSGMMEKLSNFAKLLGKDKDAEWLKNTSSKTKSALLMNLWNNSEGCFYNHIDLQTIPHMAHYYSDHIFSTLYSSIDTFMNWQSLYYLKKTLIENDLNGNPSLMRVGNLQGSHFGNDNVMPTQMAETARAFYKIGDKEQATLLLQSVGRAGTIFTDAPGNFPEQMSGLGKGEKFFLFGNPIGSFLHSIVNGLFGLEIIDIGNTLHWQPGFPDTWNHASLQLPYAKVKYELKSEGFKCKALYLADHSSTRALEFSIFLPPCNVQKVICNGKETDYEIHPALNRIELTLKAKPSISHRIELGYTKTALNVGNRYSIVEASLNELKFNQLITEVKDPQSILEKTEIKKNILKYTTRNKIGEYEIFVKLKNPEYYVPVILNITHEFDLLCDTAVYDISDNTLKIDATVKFYNYKKGKYGIEASDPYFHRTQIIDSGLINSTKFIFKEFPIPVKSLDIINFKLKDENGKIIETDKKVVFKGIDEVTDQAILKKRLDKIQSINISSLFNTNSYLNMFPGRDEELINLTSLITGGHISTKFGNFIYTPSEKKSMLLIELGRSDATSMKTILTKYSDKAVIPVGVNVSELDLLYINDAESRNTGSRVGKITLFYTNNDTAIVPLVLGKNMDFINAYTAKDVFPIFVSEKLDKITSYSAYNKYNVSYIRHLNFLPILCDKNKYLKSIQIDIEAADAQFGLIGINYLAD